ncbi:hypothetical protein A8H32_27695 [Burkholderia thailandensis]|nr:hypothetical protein A8H32_27695 [Burkholderia thailandensis]
MTSAATPSTPTATFMLKRADAAARRFASQCGHAAGCTKETISGRAMAADAPDAAGASAATCGADGALDEAANEALGEALGEAAAEAAVSAGVATGAAAGVVAGAAAGCAAGLAALGVPDGAAAAGCAAAAGVCVARPSQSTRYSSTSMYALFRISFALRAPARASTLRHTSSGSSFVASTIRSTSCAIIRF